jgi:cytochrome b561
MQWTNTRERYGSVSVALHWLALLLIAAAYAGMELKGFLPRGSAAREAIKQWHFTLGLCVLALGMVRVGLALASCTPRINPPPPPWQTWLATAMKLALYLFMVATPLLGWLFLSAKGSAIPFFGVPLPGLIAPAQASAGAIKDAHELLANLGYLLIAAHAAAALFHHHVLRDNTLRRMLP